MKRLLAALFAAVLLLSAFAFCQPSASSLIANIPDRRTVSLNGAWHFVADPYNTGGVYRMWENENPATADGRVIEYDFDAAPVLNVPGDWNSQREKLYFYEGALWYKTSFSYTKRPNTRTFLHFGAANYKTVVYLNGAKLGDHEGGFTGFNFEITDNIKDGQNILVVEVNNARRAEYVPALATDWWNYGGITRDVKVVEVPESFVENYFIQLAKGSGNEIAGWVKLNGAKQSEQVTIEIPEAGIKKTITTDANGRAEFRVPAKLTLWSPENPKLYDVRIASSSDTVRDQIGFRTIETQGTKILLNGKPVFLRGISIHEEAPFRGGRAFSEDDDRTLLTWAKELGCNYVRLAHYPHNENMTRLADRMGLMVWSEIPVYWDTAWTNSATLKVAQEMLRDNIARDQNRASIVLWSIANETPITPERTEFLKNIATYARQLDSTRLLTAAMNRTDSAANMTRTLSDPLGQYLDVLGLNEYVGWYESKIEDMDKINWVNPYDKPLLISEFGAETPYNVHGPADQKWNEEYQVRVYENQLKMLSKIPSMTGMSPWLLMDFRSPRRMITNVQDYYNRKGLVSDQGQRKKAFYVLQKYYREKTSQQ